MTRKRPMYKYTMQILTTGTPKTIERVGFGLSNNDHSHIIIVDPGRIPSFMVRRENLLTIDVEFIEAVEVEEINENEQSNIIAPPGIIGAVN